MCFLLYRMFRLYAHIYWYTHTRTLSLSLSLSPSPKYLSISLSHTHTHTRHIHTYTHTHIHIHAHAMLQTHRTHFDDVKDIGANAHLNTCFKHFIYFILEFDLVDQKGLAPLENFIKKLKEKDETVPPS